jgi:hypothetical protein
MGVSVWGWWRLNTSYYCSSAFLAVCWSIEGCRVQLVLSVAQYFSSIFWMLRTNRFLAEVWCSICFGLVNPAFVVWERVSEGRKTKGNDATHIPSSPKVLCYDAESFLVGP